MASLDEFKTWDLKALKTFLNLRGKETEGTFRELVARYEPHSFLALD